MAAMNEQPKPSNDSTTHFGFRDVPVGDKQKLVGEVFTSVARSYDLMNDLMSFGIHRLWKRHFVAISGVRRGDRVLDLAGGTGDIAALLKPVIGETGEIVVGDINAAMLGVGRDRMTDRGLVSGLRWAQLNAEALPFPDNSFDAVTMAFGLRNVTESIRKHPDQQTLKGMMERAGYGRVEVRNLSGGIVAIHRAYKL
jgi:demethylmenaquinone methyltransferase/2-methoxy-6-polyprenyl-1,4-benzoquinol methylase